MSKKDWLLPVAIVGAAFLFTRKAESEQGESESGLNFFSLGGGGESGAFDIGAVIDRIFSGVNQVIPEVVGGITQTGFDTSIFENAIKDFTDRLNVNTSGFNEIISGLNDRINELTDRINAGVTTTIDTTGKNGGSTNTIPNIINAIGNQAKNIGIGTALAVGSVAVAPAVAKVATTVAPVVGRTAAVIAGQAGAALTAPVSLGFASILGVPVAAAAGYGIGTLFNKTPAGVALLDWSAERGASVAAKQGIGAKIFGWKVVQPTEYAKSINVPANFATMTTAEREKYFAGLKK